MMKDLIFLFILLFTCLDVLAQSQDREFILTGTYEGNIPYLTLSYTDSNENGIRDTLYIHNGYFSTTGKINGAMHAWIRGDVKSTSIEDKNLTSFFIEPGEISVNIVENQFKEMKVSGSTTQTEYENLNKRVQPYDSRIGQIRAKLDELRESENGLSIQQEDSLSALWDKEKDKIRNARVKYASQNPGSLLSAYWLSVYHTLIPVDSLALYYGKLDHKVKSSYYGKKTKRMIDFLEKAQIGKPAPDFAKEFHKGGNVMSLKAFEGKVVLLDFWAGWCVPCRRSLPKIKELYETQQTKGLEVIGISYDRDQEKWKQAIKEENIESWHHIYTGLYRPNLGTQYGISSIPSYILINKEGIIIGRYTAYTTELENKIKEALE